MNLSFVSLGSVKDFRLRVELSLTLPSEKIILGKHVTCTMFSEIHMNRFLISPHLILSSISIHSGEDLSECYWQWNGVEYICMCFATFIRLSQISKKISARLWRQRERIAHFSWSFSHIFLLCWNIPLIIIFALIQ